MTCHQHYLATSLGLFIHPCRLDELDAYKSGINESGTPEFGAFEQQPAITLNMSLPGICYLLSVVETAQTL